MGLLDGLFSSKVSNPALVSAMEKYRGESSEDNLVDLWQKFLKSKVLLATTQEGAKEFGKVKQIKDAIGLPFNTVPTTGSDNLLTIVTDNESFEAILGSTSAPVVV